MKKRGQGTFFGWKACSAGTFFCPECCRMGLAVKRIYRFLVRMIIGMALIFFLNQVFDNVGLDLSVGYNAVSMAASGTLGVPGVLLLYGIVACRLL